MTRDAAAPLHGVRVLEIGTRRAGAFACAILADLGADVVKVEARPEADEAPDESLEAAARQAFDRGKRSVAADPGLAGSGDLARRLTGWADVVVEEDTSWRSAMARDDLDDLHALDALVHCTISAYGGGPGDDRPAPDPAAEDLLVQALSGNMDLTGAAGGPPCAAGIPVADLGAGVFAAIGVLAGVVADRPLRVEVAKIDVAVALLSYMAVGYFADGEVPSRVGTGHSTIFPYNAFEAADGEVVVAPFTARFWRNFATAAGRADLARDDRYRGFAQRLRAKDELLAVFTPILRQRSVQEWVRAFADADVPAGPVLPLAAAVTLEHTLARGMVADVAGPTGVARTIGSPFRFRFPDGTSFRPHLGPVPEAGADTDEVRAALGARDVRSAS